ncbi:unnamed protein product, partial [Coregonus sp. 'balchen']
VRSVSPLAQLVHGSSQEIWQTGHYGPICRGTLRKADISTAVVVKTLRGMCCTVQRKQRLCFVDGILLHGTVCKHHHLVRMLYCQTQRLPIYLRDSESLDPLQHFPVAKQMAAGLISWRCQNDKLANQRTAEVPLKWQAPERMMKHPTTDRSDVYDLMKYCWMWSFKDRPVSSAIIKLLESYTYLDDTTDIYIPEGRQLELQQEG